MHENNRFLLNKRLNELETKERRIILKSRPLTLMCILTNICNLRCVMCPRVRGVPKTLAYELIERVFEMVPYLEIISWQGGEVFLVDYFKELFLKIAEHSHISQHITTNGLLIDKEWARIFSRSNVFLLYSIDAVIKPIYESIRQNARFEDLVKSLDYVNDANAKYNGNINLKLHAVVMKRNYRDLALFPDFCKKYNIKRLFFDILWPDALPEEDIFTNPDNTAIEYLKQVIPEISNKCREYEIFFHCTFERYLNRGSIDYCERPHRKRDCLSPWKNLHLEPDGKLYPECKCTRNIGDLRNNTFEEIWNGDAMQLYRTLIKDGEADNICSEQCKLYASLKIQERKQNGAD